ncbi:MAG: leucine-rich repeat protein [Clostridia bacterium]|nr:leucine-rich repeat protein [Clostridia bacterium]
MKITLKRILSIMLAAAVAFSFGSLFAGASLSYGGPCGDGVTWSFDDDTGAVVISGTGAMDEYAIMYRPWHNICSEIKSVSIESGVTGICDFAFYNCPELSDISISDTVELIGSLAFAQCYALESISVNEENSHYCSDSFGVLFDENKTELIQYPASDNQTSYKIPDTVKTVNKDAFRYAENLTAVSLPYSLESIGDEAFYGSSLESVTIPASVTIIGKDAFGWCPSLEAIAVDNANTSFSSDDNGVLFNKEKTELIKFPNNSATASYTIPDTVTSLADNSFENCSKLRNITIPSGVVSIGDGVFFNCSLESITVDSANQNYSSDGAGALFTKDKTELIQYPAKSTSKGYNVPDGVTTIREYAFHNNQIIESISLPDSVTEVESGAFSYCGSLEYVHFGKNISKIGENIVSGNTYICSDTENCYAKEYAAANGIEFAVCAGHSVEGIMISEAEITITNKSSHHITATVTPDSATDKNVVWSSNNPDVASVDKNGLVTALSAGTAIITAASSDGKHTASCTVTVEPRYFNVVWSIDGVEETASVAEGASIEAPETPEKTGHTFIGWSPEIPDSMPENDLKFTAKWSVNSYNAVFNSNGGEWPDGSTEKTYSVKYGTQIYAPRTPSKQGYIFAGWSPEIGKMDDINGKVFNAEWTASDDTKYAVEIYTMETDGTYTKTTDNLKGTTDTTVNAEYKLEKGFILNAKKSKLSGIVAADGSLILTVYLDREIYEVVLNGEKLECLYGSEIAEPEKPEAPEGHIQEGWIDENGNKVEFPLVADENFPSEVKPDFIRQSYTVTWIVDGSKTTQSYLFEAEINAPADPVKTGYTFNGWTPAVDSFMPSHNLEYTAVWSANSYDALFDANGGKWADGSDKKTVAADFDTEITAPEAPEKAGYIFIGWSPEVGIMNDTNGKSYSAIWAASTDTLYTTEIYTMEPDGTYTKVIETLNGTTDSTVYAEFEVETGFALNEEKSVLSGVVTADNSLVLKAYIDRNSYTFTTVSDGVSTSVSYLYGAVIAEPAAPVKDGYDFTGWDSEIPSTMPSHDITVNARFEKSKYVCSDCGEEYTDKDEYNTHIAYEQAKKSIRVSIKNNPGSKTVKYGEILRLTAVTSASLPEGTKLCWYIDGVKAHEGESFDVKFESGTKTVTVKITDTHGNALRNAEGKEISDSQKVSVDSSFWQKIVSFFKNLFGMNRTVIQKIFR